MAVSGKFEIRGEGRRSVALLLALGGLQVAGYYLFASTVNGAGPLAVPQPDTPLYFQAARRICEGAPFSFSTGTAVSTGTTSVLYPFVLAIPYLLGCVGDSLIRAGFALNSLFYLIFLLGWGSAFRHWLAPRKARFAMVLLALFPVAPFCAVAQSDTGLWMAVSALMAAALATERFGWAFFFSVLGPWVRPEGLLISVAVFFFAVVCRDRKLGLMGLAGLASAAAVGLFNRLLSGVSGFSSLANKGYFTKLPFLDAVCATFADFLTIVREVMLGLASSSPRFAYFLPFVGGIVMLAGLFTFSWRRVHRSLGILSVAACGGLLTVAQSGWQGSNMDRYLVWLMPVLVFFGACGWWWLKQRLSAYSCGRYVLTLPILFGLGSGVYLFSAFGIQSETTDRVFRFVEVANDYLYRTASVGVYGWGGIAYWLPERRIAQLSGVYSPEFAHREQDCVLEILKHEPQTRFDYWVLTPECPVPDALRPYLGFCEMIGPGGFELRKANWSALSAAAVVPTCPGRAVVTRIDVGYEKDERESGYEIAHLYSMRPFQPLVCVAPGVGKTNLVEVGRLVTGHDEMTVSGLMPGKDVAVVLRTLDEVDAIAVTPWGSRIGTKYAFDEDLDLHASVDGREVACCHAHLRKRGFSDVTLRIPGKAITSSVHRIGFHGEHAAFGYWFYQ